MWTENQSLLPYNTFGIDVRCARFAEYDSETRLRAILDALRRDHPGESVLCVGAGSNLLFTRDYPGTVLHSNITRWAADVRDDGTAYVIAGSGWVWDEFVDFCVRNGWYGLENLSYIPGTVGASAVQNIGAYGAEAEQFIERVAAIELATGETRVFTHDELRYAYRQSAFKQELRGRYAVTTVTFRLSTTFRPATGYGSLGREIAARGLEGKLTPQALRQLIIDIRRAKLPEPTELGNGGSFFVNPVISREAFALLQADYPAAPHYDVEGGVKVPAGWLIEQCGWKGRRLGPAGVYERQALVLVNHGGATGADIVALSDAVRDTVRAKFCIEIQP